MLVKKILEIVCDLARDLSELRIPVYPNAKLVLAGTHWIFPFPPIRKGVFGAPTSMR